MHVGGAASPAIDGLNLSFGVRDIHLDANTGMKLNGLAVKMRGYCDHSSFGGVGSAVRDRVQLFHAQALRAAGGNSWRMAHNPPVPARLDVADRVGVLILDENHFCERLPLSLPTSDPIALPCEHASRCFGSQADIALILLADGEHGSPCASPAGPRPLPQLARSSHASDAPLRRRRVQPGDSSRVAA